MNPRVEEVSVLRNYKFSIVFSNGERKIFDCSGLLEFGVFKELRDYSYFRLAKASGGTVAWPHEQDICPDTLYLDSIGETGQTGASTRFQAECKA